MGGVRGSATLLLILFAGCGSGSSLVPAAEPARSPELDATPAGRVVRVGHKPEGLAFDARSGLLAVGLANPDRLALVDGGDGRVVRRVSLPESPRHLGLARPGGPVLVPAERAGLLVEVALPSGRTRAVGVGEQPHDAAGAAGREFVGNERGHSVSVIEDGRQVRVLDAPVGPGGVAAGRGDVAVVGVRSRKLELFDARTLRSLGAVNVGLGPTHVVARDSRFFVVDTRGNGLLEVHTEPLRIHRRTHLAGAPYGIAYDRTRRRFWVTLTGLNQVAELTDRRLLRTFPTVRQPNSVAVDPGTGRVFVASRKDGTLQLLDPPPYRG
jgi:DNA-binding beta-propeller fold protein YncE